MEVVYMAKALEIAINLTLTFTFFWCGAKLARVLGECMCELSEIRSRVDRIHDVIIGKDFEEESQEDA